MASSTTNAISQLQDNSSSSSKSSSSGLNKVAEDKALFLKLLMAQLTNQDPLNPVEDKEFISQMAQFTSVEQLMNINENMETVSSSLVKQQLSVATNLIGTMVLAKGSEASVWHDPEGKADSVIASVYATVPQDLSSLTMNVNKMDSDGNSLGIVWSKNLGPMSAGQIDTKNYWQGTDASGAKLSNGVYNISFSGLDKNGKNILIETKSAGLVIGVVTKTDGDHSLTLKDGREVTLSNVELVQVYVGNSSATTDDDSDADKGDDDKGDDDKGDDDKGDDSSTEK